MKEFKRWLRQWLFEDEQKPKVRSSPPLTSSDARDKASTLTGADKERLDKPLALTEMGIFSAGWFTDPGRVRGNNEDALFVFMGEQEGSEAIPPFGLFILADGMGGHQGGELASALASRVVASYLVQQIYLPILRGVDRAAKQKPLNQLVEAAITQANQEVSHTLPGSGTTLTCGMVVGSRLFVGHVGDSRAYLLREGTDPKQLTDDHSFVRRLVDMGQLTPAEAEIHPQRNVLYRAVGQAGNLDVDVSSLVIQSGDKLLLCSDGLWGMVSETDIWRILASSPNPRDACIALIDAANQAGGNDNVTVILVEILRLMD
jgi:protein phosphatase